MASLTTGGSTTIALAMLVYAKGIVGTLARPRGRARAARARALPGAARAARGRRDAARDRGPLLRTARAARRGRPRRRLGDRLVRAADRGDAGRPDRGLRHRAADGDPPLDRRVRGLHRARRAVRGGADGPAAVRTDARRDPGHRARLGPARRARALRPAARRSGASPLARLHRARRPRDAGPDRPAAPGRERRLREAPVVPRRRHRAPRDAARRRVEGALRVLGRGDRARRAQGPAAARPGEAEPAPCPTRSSPSPRRRSRRSCWSRWSRRCRPPPTSSCSPPRR